ncbi:putative membrane protein [Sphingomonas kyeonggiensis]|uniref:CopD family protein n=1 Tax=Sphingomonas kyeonggiensis TaxID=1268553 RepID=UPI00277E3A97|nr:CopD family protein [Sphingomonas kyeonggiensis]MDQ0250203.1 putative membrane protein [Sphingomonas kyeonggiensis]
MPYLWLKAVHVAAVLLFIGGLFAQTFALAAAEATAPLARWDRLATVPAMLLVWVTGATIAVEAGWFASPWLWAKLAFVLALTGLHGIQSGKLRRLRRAGGEPSAATPALRVAAFIATAVASIAVLVVAKPF